MATIPRTRKLAKPIGEKTRKADEALREELRHADLEKFAKLLDKAVNLPKSTHRS